MRGRIAMGATAMMLAVAVPALAQTASRTLTLDKPCYSTGDVITMTGSGWTPNGTLSLAFSGAQMLSNGAAADAQGNLHREFEVLEEDLFRLLLPSQPKRDVDVVALDEAAANAGAPEPAAATRVTFSHFGVFSNQRLRRMNPRRRLSMDVVGFTGMEGKRAYLHYVRAGRRRATVPLGTLRGACGEVSKTLPRAFPMRRPQRGTWRLVFNTSARSTESFPRVTYASRVR